MVDSRAREFIQVDLEIREKTDEFDAHQKDNNAFRHMNGDRYRRDTDELRLVKEEHARNRGRLRVGSSLKHALNFSQHPPTSEVNHHVRTAHGRNERMPIPAVEQPGHSRRHSIGRPRAVGSEDFNLFF